MLLHLHPYRAYYIVARLHRNIISKKIFCGRNKPIIIYTEVYKTISSIPGNGKVNICCISIMISAVVKKAVEVPIGGVHRKPRHKLLMVAHIIIHSNRLAPCFAFISRFYKPYIGIIASVTLVAPVYINGSAMWAIANIA